ncbi:prolipoprotein diacylglyceryl transferase [Candidatus Woesearchaeota archaeon]|jgi:phosphatidylglycerol---prolipoprotein diacylglyceryl transferase|nr:prolipoprotein diacylglyceryl transferase [Candidatus Woesearchaeota archaeon]MBT3537760.1 prolipoprotein diacylglyceryl transferase [Candidatus Woesearchaeota archaeon]MBT4697891.1 prolipoprotein diacylglyceryl transferase [Candidatus Woesearchaeota archaeon]MBT4717449.1 prolipoprotein diacylglyceryl transferase [Candidatus Woesearchaeota archaeon]MBT7105429.1 prolipoprotein diacylglyceryl transferase [Candidatus Woesearchaeota archaeon]
MNPILLELGPFQVRYYGVLMALAFLIGFFILRKLAKEKKVFKDLDQVADYVFWMAIGILVGARLLHCLVYEPDFYLTYPLEILYIWKGGLASHGGMIGGTIAALIFARIKKIKFYRLADITMVPVALGAMFVRLGNFTNGELVGRVTPSWIGVEFDGYEGLRHPSQLYEAFKNFVIFLIMYKFNLMKKLPHGFVFWSFFFIYGIFRFIVEFWKDFPLYNGLTIGQYLSLPIIIIGALGIWLVTRRKLNAKKQPKKKKKSK